MPPRVIAILCIIQTAALTGSWLMMRYYAQIWERLPAERVAEGSSWPGWMQFARWAVWSLLFVPAILMIASTGRTRKHNGISTVRPRWLWLCVAITAVVLCYSAAIVVMARNGPPRKVKSLNL
jgi:hypothetical protein